MRGNATVIALVIMATALGAGAEAQTTNCVLVGSQLVCRPSGGLSDPYANSGVWAETMRAQQAQQAQMRAQTEAILRARAEREAAQQAADQAAAERAPAENAEQQRQFRAQNAGRMVAAGQCKEARSYALSEGDFALANEVTQQCASPGIPPQP